MGARAGEAAGRRDIVVIVPSSEPALAAAPESGAAEDHVTREQRQAAAAFLRACQQGDRSARSQTFAALYPRLRQQILRLVQTRQNCLQPGQSEDDVVQEVCTRLQVSPPTSEGRDPLVALHAWCKTTATHYLIDSKRRRDVRREQLTPLAGDDESAEGLEHGPMQLRDRAPSADARLADAQLVAVLREHLSVAYPPGARLVAALGQQPDATVAELAEALNTTVANVYQIRLRLQLAAVEFRRSRAS